MEFNIRRDRKGRLSISTLKEVAGFGVASLPCLYRNNSIEIGQQITLKRLHGWLHSYLRSCEKCRRIGLECGVFLSEIWHRKSGLFDPDF